MISAWIKKIHKEYKLKRQLAYCKSTSLALMHIMTTLNEDGLNDFFVDKFKENDCKTNDIKSQLDKL